MLLKSRVARGLSQDHFFLALSRALFFFFFFGSVSFFPLHVGLHVSEAGKEDLLKYQVGGRKF